MFALGQLLAAAEGPMPAATFKEPWANLYNQVMQWRQQAPLAHGSPATDEQIEQWITSNVLQNRLLTSGALNRFKQASGKTLSNASITDFQKYAPLIAGVRDPFAASIAEVFLSYNARRVQHEFAQWRFATKGEGSPMSDEDFFGRFGPPPWELLDETLRIVGLPYTFDPPASDIENVNYEVVLSNDSGDLIRPGELSSGERVLLAIAMGLFTGSQMTDAIELPRLLLLDEADASLHPSMVKSLLTVIEEVFVTQYGVRVILATHSPSTVALAPESALYVMSRSAPRLRKTTTDEAMQLLTVGISSLSVKLDNRRQVFVESEYDQAIFQELFGLLKGRLASDRSAEFVAVGRRDIGGGCDRVKALVKELRAAGVTTVSGVVDRDRRQGAPDHVLFIKDRYSIENLVFDPLILGVFLLREQILTAEDLGLPIGTRNFELRAEHAQTIVDAMATRLGFSSPVLATTYAGSFDANIPEELLEMQGHALEDHVLSTFAPLHRYKTDLKRQIVKRAVGDVPDYVPQSLIVLLEELLDN